MAICWERAVRNKTNIKRICSEPFDLLVFPFFFFLRKPEFDQFVFVSYLFSTAGITFKTATEYDKAIVF